MHLTDVQLEYGRDNGLDLDPQGNGFDYRNQAWIISGKYYPCGHAGTVHSCDCYGRKHAGESINLG